MEIKNIFDSNQYRNILLEIISYFTYDEISNLLCLNNEIRKYLKDIFLSSDENGNILNRIINKRFFDRRECKFYLNETFLQPKFTISNDKIFWKRYYPNIQDGDIIYLTKCDKFININSSQLFVRYKFDHSSSQRRWNASVFPIEYWRKIGKMYPFRLWIIVKVYYESLKEWMNHTTIRFIDFNLDPKLYPDDSAIEICFTFVEELIYIYKSGK
jgi:hypothetical protein